jgi:hypothetical protein
MKIQDMFIREIDRDIKGVIKVGQGDEANVKQELDEYVVTRELQKHFADFFASYKKGINGYTDKMGVWISGFFGSGKSHFLKILSYLLENREVEGKKALDYFIDDRKITDPMVLADMKLATSVTTDVVLFNIDSKSEMSGKQSKDAIVSVFLKVFNEMQGFCGSIPILADLERQLVEVGRYDEFKRLFEADYGKPWETSRHKFDFIQDSIVDVLVQMNFMSEAAARNWCERAVEPYNISIDDFARLVKEYIERRGNNHHIVFLVDEIGQYIGDDSKLMLNLQTVTEDLGTACKGKVWIVVTSQQDIDSITKTKGNDFSKIQGRFDTRLSLSSANVDEVIKKRILEKNTTADQTLKLLYEQKSTIIKNLIVFNDGVEKKLYTDKEDFSTVYPFIPYQFNLLGSVLTSIRTHGASGKHLAEGERSMIALFKESAMRLMERAEGTLVPFNLFYDALHQFLDHSHKGVISKAMDNEIINPDKVEECFAVNVLKTLFMIKYVKEITANIDNITSLMISDIDTDRIVLKAQVEEALKVLSSQTLIQKNGEIYVFLTDEEQEINKEIDHLNVEMSEVIGKVSELVFEDIFKENKYRYPAFNGRYNFAFNQVIDDRPYKANQNHDIGVRILTPNSDFGDDETTLRIMSGQQKEVLVVLPNDSAFLDETRRALQIEKYLRLNTTSALPKFDQIKEAKRDEMRKRNENAKLFLTEALKQADIYVNGDKSQIGSKEVSSRINEALGRLVNTVYHKLSYIDTAMSEANIRALFKSTDQMALSLENGTEPNQHALNDMLSYISTNSSMHMKTSMKSLMDRFMKAPYGFVEDDVEWLVAKLFKNGDISFTVNGSNVTLFNKSDEEIVRYITKREYVEKLLTEKREKPDERLKKSVREVMKELFGTSASHEDDDALMRSFQKFSRELLNEKLEMYELMYQTKAFPGRNVVAQGKNLLRSILQVEFQLEFYKKIHAEREELLDFAEDFEPVKLFFGGEQKAIYEKALNLISIYDQSKTFIVHEQVEQVVSDIKAILRKESPYGDIPKLPELLDRFAELYAGLLEEMVVPVKAAIDDARERVFEVLETKEYKEQFKSRFLMLFKEISEKAETCNNVATLQNIKIEADALKVRLLNELARKDEMIALDRVKEQQAKLVVDQSEGQTIPKLAPEPKLKKRKNISIKSVSLSASWQIESPQDVEKYVAELKQRILKELEENTIVNIEF